MSKTIQIKVSEANGEALNWAVAQCEGIAVTISQCGRLWLDRGAKETWGDQVDFLNWGAAGEIIDREHITVAYDKDDGQWIAVTDLEMRSMEGFAGDNYTDGPTALVAALRCWVTKQMGPVVDVPEALVLQRERKVRP